MQYSIGLAQAQGQAQNSCSCCAPQLHVGVAANPGVLTLWLECFRTAHDSQHRRPEENRWTLLATAAPTDSSATVPCAASNMRLSPRACLSAWIRAHSLGLP
eukprot:scaffold3826_cov407-Prasinococcus_capsulatus_cf.AAC.24